MIKEGSESAKLSSVMQKTLFRVQMTGLRVISAFYVAPCPPWASAASGGLIHLVEGHLRQDIPDSNYKGCHIFISCQKYYESNKKIHPPVDTLGSICQINFWIISIISKFVFWQIEAPFPTHAFWYDSPDLLNDFFGRV